MSREELLSQIWESQDEAYQLMTEYDALPHFYGEVVLYQSEAYVVHHIGKTPDITNTELAEILNKTTSACSQLVRKLTEKGLVEQIRNPENKRQYHLRLTAMGEKLYRDHMEFNEKCQEITFHMLEGFCEEELATYLRIQKRINEAYQGDVERSKERYGKKEEV